MFVIVYLENLKLAYYFSIKYIANIFQRQTLKEQNKCKQLTEFFHNIETFCRIR